MGDPLTSVIIAVKNGERFLAAAINSVLQQDYRPLEIIVVDDHSTDRTAEVAQSFKQVQYIYNDGDPGIASSRNLGLDAVEGELIAFNSHDDLWAPRKLSLQVNRMIRYPETGCTFTRIRFFLEPGCSIPRGFKKKLLKGDYVGYMPETLVAHRSLFRIVGRFNPDLIIADDVDWFIRVRDAGIPIAVIPEVLLFKRVHDANTSTLPSVTPVFGQEMLTVLKRSISRRQNRAP